MEKLKGRKVTVQYNGDQKIGTVRESYLTRNRETIYIIELEGGEFIKANERNVEEYKAPEPEKNDDEITISAERYADIACDLASKYDSMAIGLVLTLFSRQLWDKLAEETKGE